MHVVVLAVVSLDGCLTRHDAPGAGGLSSAADTAQFRAQLARCDASICGKATYLEERDRVLASARRGDARRRVVLTSDPAAFSDDVVPGSLDFVSDSPQTVLDHLRAEGRQRIAILGGSSVYNSFLGANLVDELSLTVEARVFGSGTRLAGVETPIDPSLQLTGVTRIGPNTVLLTLARG